MTSTRRQFLQAGVSATALMSGGALLATPSGIVSFALPPTRFNRVIYDERFAAGRVFGAEAARLGQRVQPIRGEVHRLWNEDLYYRWQESKAPVAGMTDFRSLFLLEMMAADAGLRVVYRGHHVPRARGTSHEIFGPRTLRQGLAERIEVAGTDWTREAARIITAFPRLDALTARESDVLSARSRVLDGRALVSWIITSPLEQPA